MCWEELGRVATGSCGLALINLLTAVPLVVDSLKINGGFEDTQNIVELLLKNSSTEENEVDTIKEIEFHFICIILAIKHLAVLQVSIEGRKLGVDREECSR